eukprot:115590_1
MAIFLYSALLNYVMASESVIWFDDMETSPNGWTGTGTFTIADQQKSRQSMTSNSVELVNGSKSTLIKSITIGTEYDHYDLVLSTWISNSLDTSNDKCVVSYRYNSQSWVDAYFQRGSDTSGMINWMMYSLSIYADPSVDFTVRLLASGDGSGVCYFDALELTHTVPSTSEPTQPSTSPESMTSSYPSTSPSDTPSKFPTVSPSDNSSQIPTMNPSNNPTENPSLFPTVRPSVTTINTSYYSPSSTLSSTTNTMLPCPVLLVEIGITRGAFDKSNFEGAYRLQWNKSLDRPSWSVSNTQKYIKYVGDSWTIINDNGGALIVQSNAIVPPFDDEWTHSSQMGSFGVFLTCRDSYFLMSTAIVTSAGAQSHNQAIYAQWWFYMVIVLVVAFIVLIIFFYHRVKMRRVKSPIDDCDEIEPGVYHGEVQENSHEELEITEEGNKPRGANNKVTTKGTTKGASNGNENEHVQRQEGKTQRDIAEC